MAEPNSSVLTQTWIADFSEEICTFRSLREVKWRKMRIFLVSRYFCLIKYYILQFNDTIISLFPLRHSDLIAMLKQLIPTLANSQ